MVKKSIALWRQSDITPFALDATFGHPVAVGCSFGIHIRLKQIHRCSTSSSPACVCMLPLLNACSYATRLSCRRPLAIQLISCDSMRMFEILTAIR